LFQITLSFTAHTELSSENKVITGTADARRVENVGMIKVAAEKYNFI
jgi:hypothetical protein